MPGRVTDETESIPTPTEHGENIKRAKLTWTPLESEKIFLKCCFCYTWYYRVINIEKDYNQTVKRVA